MEYTEDDFAWIMLTDGLNTLARRYGPMYGLACALQAVVNYLTENPDSEGAEDT